MFHLYKNAQNRKVQGAGYIMRYTTKGKIKIIAKYPITYGINGYGKKKYKDRKTPIGKYKVRKIGKIYNDKKRYGTWNLSLNYPHGLDKRAKKTGSGIAIHGGRVSGTYGCIRVLDGSFKYPKPGRKNIAVFAKYSRVGTPVFISHSIPRGLRAGTGDYLSSRASRYWKEMLKYGYTEGGLVRRLKSF